MSKLVRYEWSENWYIRYRDSAGNYRKISTRTTDEELAAQIKSKFDADQEKPPVEQERTISKLLDAYLTDRKDNVASYDSLFHASKPLKKIFGHTQPRHISELQNKQYIKSRRKEGRSDGTIIKELVTLRSALSYGERKGWMEKAPYIIIPPRPAPKDRWLTHEEANALIAACKTPHIRMFILLALKTGARKSAILELTWDRVSFDRDIIVYPLPGKVHGKKRRAIVPITEGLKAELEQIRQLAQSDWVIEYNGKPVRKIQTAWTNTLEESGIDHCTIHDMRRTCATWLIQAGIQTVRVARMLGDTEKMIEKVYGHHSPDYLKDAAKALDW